MRLLKLLIQPTLETLYMVSVSSLFALALGLVIVVVLRVPL